MPAHPVRIIVRDMIDRGDVSAGRILKPSEVGDERRHVLAAILVAAAENSRLGIDDDPYDRTRGKLLEPLCRRDQPIRIERSRGEIEHALHDRDRNIVSAMTLS